MIGTKLCPRRFFTIASGWLVSLLAGCAAIGPQPRQTTLAADRVDLPTTASIGCLFIDAKIDGAGPFRLLVDTGSDGLVIAADVAKEAGLKAAGTLNLIGPAGRVAGQVTFVDRFESGGMRLNSLYAATFDPGQVALVRRTIGRIDGFVGIGLFKDVVLDLDFPGHQVSVERLAPGKLDGVPSVPYKGLEPEVVIAIGGRRLPSIVDSGSGFHLIIPDLDSYALAVPITPDHGLGGVTIGSSTFDRGENSQLLGEVRWGPVVWTNPPLRWQRDGKRGNIGVGVLDGLTIAIDQHSHRIYFLSENVNRKWAIGEQ